MITAALSSVMPFSAAFSPASLTSEPLAAVRAAGETESLKPGLDASAVAPGTIGFVMTLLMVVLVVLLALDHTRRQRRLKNRFDYAMAREAEERAGAHAEAGEHVPAQDAGTAQDHGTLPETHAEERRGTTREAGPAPEDRS